MGKDDSNQQALKEEVSELIVEAKANFKNINNWYNGDNEIATFLRKDFGVFPLFSRDLVNWKHLRPVLKAYNRHSSVAREANKGNQSNIYNLKRKRSRWGKKKVEEKQVDASKLPKIDNQGNITTIVTKKSRWGAASGTKNNSSSSLIQKSTQGTLATIQQKSFWLRLKIDQINKRIDVVAIDAKKRSKALSRSASPEPTYDSNGRRINTREWRMRHKMENERQDLMEELVLLNPSLKPKNMKFRHLQRTVYVPITDYPGYNFLGLLIGPRGSTQRRLEKETKCKITIKGKGSVPEGSRKQPECPDMPLHVVIQAEEQEDLDKACNIVEKLMTPGEDNLFLESHRQKQMQELALINGTINKEDFCLNCGEKGHGTWECPNQSLATYSAGIKIECKICHEKSHITADCPMKNKNINNPVDKAQHKLDKDYQEFMTTVSVGALIDTKTTLMPPMPPPLPK